ncbi:MAG TPA: glycoside hydrolase family 2 TIM barrel-domain containing protein [Chitinophagaceae bacterium]|nr:glycoside hydrolase family 2 TIM barrel-domain containing protein [Chitinophagaceae bacterium]HPN59200.1 glycoside hydrolase family 2 TIM barrel-domain containing protein [Chitinophagaceae bacterium]
MKYSVTILLLVLNQLLFAQEISLAGNWRFAMDARDEGIVQQWASKKLSDQILLPGTMITRNKGEEVGLKTKWTASIYDSSFFFQPRLEKFRQPDNYKVPFWLTPQKYYVGAAWYQRDILIPADWKGKQVNLFLERIHIGSAIWIDGNRIDSFQNSLSVPHVYDLTRFASPGKHTITIRVDNRTRVADVGQDSHSVSDHTQGNWNGIIGRISLQAKSAFHIEDVQIYPLVQQKKIKVRVELQNNSAAAQSVQLNFLIQGKGKKNNSVNAITAQVNPGDTIIHEQLIDMGNELSLWNEFNPFLYSLQVSMKKESQQRKTVFGMREITVKDKSILLNGQKIFLRGDLNNCEFPLTGHPPMDVKSWLNVFTTLKNYGLNHVRFHSWCPPEAAFTAADELGIYLQPEAPTWPNHGTSVGDGRFIDQYIYDETNRMVKAYGNHPSFLMLAAGNEPAGRNQSKYLADFVHYWKAKDARRIYTGASVATSWPLVPENEYMVKSGARGLNWNSKAPSSMDDYQETMNKYPVPFVQHEQGQWCVFPDFSEISLYTGAYKARNFELFREDMKAQGLLPLAPAFLQASGKLQALCYKMEMERSLRTKDLAGFQLLGLQDFPGQGTALVGVLNAFYKEKGYINETQFRQFCNSVVPLARLPRFTFSNNEEVTAAIELYQYGPADMNNTILDWKLVDQQGSIQQTGSMPAKNYSRGALHEVGSVRFELRGISAPQELQLIVSVRGTVFRNQWSIWVYPAGLPMVEFTDRPDLLVTDTLDDKAVEILNNGGKVFLNLYGKVTKGREVVQAFTPVFWNTSWFKMRPPHTLGLLIDSASPAFRFFPTASHSDLQWWEVVTHSQVMHLEDFSPAMPVLIRPIDTWFMNRNLGLAFEARIGKGRLLITSISLNQNSAVMRQLRFSLYQHLLFATEWSNTSVSPEQIRALTAEPSRFVFDAYTKDSPDELKPIKNVKQ